MFLYFCCTAAIRTRCLIFFLENEKRERYQIRLPRNFTATGADSSASQFVLRCYCTFPVLIANYDSISPPWHFTCSCSSGGGLAAGPLILPFPLQRALGTAAVISRQWGLRHCLSQITTPDLTTIYWGNTCLMALWVQFLLRSQRRCKLETTG